MYRRLGRSAGRLACILQRASDELQNLENDTEKMRQPSTSPHLTNLKYSNEVDSANDEGCSCISATSTALQESKKDERRRLRSGVKEVCDWLRETGLDAWLPIADDPHDARGYTFNWLSSIWTPPASESAYHSLTYSVGSASSLLSDTEKTLVNAAAHRLRLPRRFSWPLVAASSSKLQIHESGKNHSPSPLPLSQNTPVSATSTMLWPTAMRTTSGDTVPRQISSSSSAATMVLTAALPTLPSVTTARQMFAPAPTPPTKFSLSLSSAPMRSTRTETSVGGGVLFSSRLEAYLVLLHTARTQALTRSTSQHNVFAGQEADARQLGKLVLYTGDQVDPLLLRAAQLIGIAHLRVLQTVAGDRQLHLPPFSTPSSRGDATNSEAVARHYNYTVDVTRLQARLVEDVAAGLYPMMVVGTFGSGLSGAVDPLAALGDFCAKLGVWYHVDASHGGAALLASCSDEDSQHTSGASFPGQCRLSAVAAEFQEAALMADSVLFPAGRSALPYSILPASALFANGNHLAGAALLFVAHVRKVAWAVQSLGEPRQSTFNQHVTPCVSDSDVLRVSSLAHSCAWLMNQAAAAVATRVCRDSQGMGKGFPNSQREQKSFLTAARADHHYHDDLVQMYSTDTCMSLAHRVALHQQFTSAVLQAIRGDGRFDASLDASLFGMVCLRWLTAADEATSELARAWADVLNTGVRETFADGPESPFVRNDSAKVYLTSLVPPLKVFVGIVQLQRRLWVTVSFGELPATAGGEGNNCFASLKEAQEYVLGTLDAAARRVKPSDIT